MPRLLDRNKQIPGGYKFWIPELKWQAPAWASFNIIVQGAMAAASAHPAIAQRCGWPTDYSGWADRVDEFNAKMCLQMGWKDYVADAIAAAPPSFIPAPQQDNSKLAAAGASVKRIWAGVRTLNDWLDSGEPAVAADLAASRAAVCAACPKNVPGDFTQWFTKPASEAIRRQLEKVQGRNLTTPHDAKLNICDVCYCPMKLKVHTPFSYIKAHLSEDVANELRKVPGCWIIAELSKA